MHPMRFGVCSECGLAQTIDPVSANELVPSVDWITYNEPEGHLDKVAESLAGLPGIRPGASFLGVSFKDDTLLARMRQRGFNTYRLSLPDDLGVTRKGCGVETIQSRLTLGNAENITATRGKADVVIARHILEHAYDLPGFVAAAGMLARPDGYLVFEVPDCTLAFDKLDLTTLWEEHIVYFTPFTFKGALTRRGADLVSYACYPYPFENCLVAAVRLGSGSVRQAPAPGELAAELSRVRAFASSLDQTETKVRGLLSRFRNTGGKIAIFGAGHLACTWVHLLQLKDLVDFVVDDNPHKQGRFLPGSQLLIRGSSALMSEAVKLALLSVNPEAEEKIITKNKGFTEKGGSFASIFPASRHSLEHVIRC
jgi:hypothetical protein